MSIFLLFLQAYDSTLIQNYVFCCIPRYLGPGSKPPEVSAKAATDHNSAAQTHCQALSFLV